ncbi:MAG: tetratricopeptide repeat protein [Anaerolineae bacterium]|nr:tetratricopeptide repeat protein [Anaerolineae bacterium]MDW8068196.1 tetratricopeptide repeat protein [Anaerolineae bacterium]
MTVARLHRVSGNPVRVNRLHYLMVGIWLLAFTGCAAGLPSATPSPLPPSPLPTATPDPAIFYEQGLACQQAGDWECARLAFSRTLELNPGFAFAYRARAAVYLALGDGPMALRDAQTAIMLVPEDAEAYILLGEILRRAFHDPLQALDAYDAAVQRDPALAPVLFPVRWECAVVAARSDRMAELAAEYARLHPDDPMRMYYRGRALLAHRASRIAIQVVGETIQQEEGLAALWFVLGEAYAADGAWREAVICYEQARALMTAGDPSLQAVSRNPAATLALALGTAYLYAGRCGDAEAVFRYAQALGSDRPDLPTLIGQAMICQRQ